MHGVVKAIAMLMGVSAVTFAAGKAPADLTGDWVAELRQKELPNQASDRRLRQRFEIDAGRAGDAIRRDAK